MTKYEQHCYWIPSEYRIAYIEKKLRRSSPDIKALNKKQ